MPYGYRTAGRGLVQAGQTISSMLLQNFARRKDQELWKEREEITDEHRREAEKRAFTHRMKEMDKILANNKDLFEYQQSLGAEFKAFENDPYWRTLSKKADSPEGTDEDRAIVNTILSIRQRQAQYLPLEKEHLDFIQGLHQTYPTIAISLYGMEHKNNAFMKELDVRRAESEARIKQSEAMAGLYGARTKDIKDKPDTETQKTSDALEGKILNAQKRITQIRENEDYQKGKTYRDKLEREAGVVGIERERQMKRFINITESGDQEIARLEKQIKEWEARLKEMGVERTKPTDESYYTPQDIKMIEEKNLVGAIVKGTREGKTAYIIYRGRGKEKGWEDYQVKR